MSNLCIQGENSILVVQSAHKLASPGSMHTDSVSFIHAIYWDRLDVPEILLKDVFKLKTIKQTQLRGC